MQTNRMFGIFCDSRLLTEAVCYFNIWSLFFCVMLHDILRSIVLLATPSRLSFWAVISSTLRADFFFTYIQLIQ